ncbi:MAG: helix-turn-helix transcriptional regulator [Dehalobacter sp.]|nr:helix-turn-helix transcriptional regulator [Dehalobacter sp.]
METRNRLLQIRLDISAKEGIKLTQEDMGKIIKVNKKILSRYENQEGQPSLGRAIDIAARLTKYVKKKYIVEDIFYNV